MDNYRRRPPMEGFSRPGSLGGEATMTIQWRVT